MYASQEFLLWLSILFIIYYIFITSVIYVKRNKDDKSGLGKDIIDIDNDINKELVKLGLENPSPSPSPLSEYNEEVKKVKEINDKVNKINKKIPEININRLKPYEKDGACYKAHEKKVKAKCEQFVNYNNEMNVFQNLMKGIK